VGTESSASDAERKLLAIVGSPNVGKSVVFGALTGAYATVSNYPGTTVEVTRSNGTIADATWRIVDTPGLYSLLPTTEEERVTRTILLEETPAAVLHVMDAKNLERMLPLTLQLLEADLPVVLALNMMDEAEARGVEVDAQALATELGIAVVPTVFTSGRGVDEAKAAISAAVVPADAPDVPYAEGIAEAVEELLELTPERVKLGPKAVALLLLQRDEEMLELLTEEGRERAETIIATAEGRYAHPLSYVIAARRHEFVSQTIAPILSIAPDHPRPFVERLSALLTNPWTGVPVLLLVLYFGLFKFVGGFGAGVVVDYVESTVFEAYVNPVVEDWADRMIPWPALYDLVAGEYGVFTLGLRYAIAIILPIVTFFFLVFSILEDTGYLPRLALLVDRVFKAIGLSGRGVIPIVLGLGCDTMATLVTRTLPTRRERVIATVLLALAVPCSAQLGVILALLHGRPVGMAVWAGVVGATFLAIGFLCSRFVKGESPHFFMELPPLRLPTLKNVFTKTYTRVHWYLKEVLPVFAIASVFIWLGQLSGFFRRDYGAAGLYDLETEGLLTGTQLVVAAIALTLFLPCIAQLLVNIKERGIRLGLAVSVLALVIAFSVAYLVNLALTATGVIV